MVVAGLSTQWRFIWANGGKCRSQEQDLVGIVDRSPCRAHSPATRPFILPYHTTWLVSYPGSISSSLCVCGCWLVPQWKLGGVVQASEDENTSGPYVY